MNDCVILIITVIVSFIWVSYGMAHEEPTLYDLCYLGADRD